VREFVVPIIKASTRDTTKLEALACEWLGQEQGWQVTMVWSNEAMPPGLFVKDKLYKAVRLLRCAQAAPRRRQPRVVCPLVRSVIDAAEHVALLPGSPPQIRPPA
jgi:hypothetical protein